MVDDKMIKEAYCDRIHKNVPLDAYGLPTPCRHLVIRNGKPVCKKVIEFPLPTPGAIAKLMFRTIFEPMVVFTSMTFGRTVLPSWWCKLCAEGATPSRALEIAGKAVGFLAGPLANAGAGSASDAAEGILDVIRDVGEGGADDAGSR